MARRKKYYHLSPEGMAAKRLTCKSCNTKFLTKLQLNEHMKLHTDEEVARVEEMNKCSMCSKVLKSQLMLKRHLLVCKKSSRHVKTNSVNHNQTSRKSSSPSASKSPSTSKKKRNELTEHMFTKVQSIFDSTKSTKNSSDKDPVLLQKSTLSSDGVQNMSLVIKNSMKKINNKAAKVKERNLRNKSKMCLKSRAITKEMLASITHIEPLFEGTPLGESDDVQSSSGYEQDSKDMTRPSRNGQLAKSAPSTSVSKKVASKPSGKPASKRVVQKKTVPVKKNTASKSTEAGSGTGPKKKNDIEEKDDESNKKDDDIESNKDDYDKENESSDISDSDEDSKAAIMATIEQQLKSLNEMDDGDGSNRIFTCAQCAKTFSRKYHLDRHLKVSTCSGLPPPSYPCQVCNRVYTRKDNLREHLRMHTGELHRKKNHKCTFCNKAFHGQSLLIIHMRTHTGEKPYSCDYCSKTFPSAGALAKHRRTHTGEKPFSCPECDQKFSLKGTLNRHLRVHSGYRPHLCMYCGKRFIQIGGLKAHLFYHTGENGFKCEDCGKVFNRKARLHMHKLYVHSSNRPYICERCHKSFTRKEDLYRHSVLHTGEKPYNCPTCNKSFAIKPSLKLHLLTHTKEEPRSCHECGRAFIRKDCLLRHMRKRHRELLDKIMLDEKDAEKFGEPNAISSRMLSEDDLCEKIQELLSLLVEESTLVGFGWPDKPVAEVLESVIKRCGHTPVTDDYNFMDRMRENAKLLFTVVIDDNAVKTLLNNQTVDEVILHVLRLAKT